MNCPVCSVEATQTDAFGDVVLLRCISCGHRFTDVAALERLEEYDEDWEVVHERWLAHPHLKLFRAITAALAREVGSPSVVDIGAGNGALLRFVQQRLPQAQLTAIEPALEVRVPGVEVIKEDIAEFDAGRRTWDVAVSLATIEHVVDARRFAAQLHELVKPGGLAVVMTLDDSSVLYAAARALKRLGWSAAFERLYDRQHLHHFTPHSLELLLEQAGFTIESRIRTNVPLAAVDMPRRSPLLLGGVALVFAIGRLTRRTYLQTVVARNG